MFNVKLFAIVITLFCGLSLAQGADAAKAKKAREVYSLILKTNVAPEFVYVSKFDQNWDVYSALGLRVGYKIRPGEDGGAEFMPARRALGVKESKKSKVSQFMEERGNGEAHAVVWVKGDGTPGNIWIVTATNAKLARAMVEDMVQWRYVPATLGSTNVDSLDTLHFMAISSTVPNPGARHGP